MKNIYIYIYKRDIKLEEKNLGVNATLSEIRNELFEEENIVIDKNIRN